MKNDTEFKKLIWGHYKKNSRAMPWREDTSPYSIVVSEIMLQQTQVSRVVSKYQSWMKRFPNWSTLAKAPVKDVLHEWSGLGYNRRALSLTKIAETLDGKELPDTYEQLLELPGIGPNTAGSILAFAFNKPQPFIETNIRSVYIDYFFKNTGRKITDKDLIPLIEATLDRDNPREWYWALMDYGAYLKSMQPNPSRRSKHHVKQTPFKGSNREVRSNILKLVMKKPSTESAIEKTIGKPIQANLAALTREGFIEKIGTGKAARYQIAQ